MIDNKIIERTAKTLNVDASALKAKADEVYANQGATWRAAGKSEADAYALSLKVAGSQVRNENAALARSGASKLEGMFVSVPRTKEWGKLTYNKMKNQLLNASEEMRQQFVDRGDVVLLEDNGDGSYTRYAREDFFGGDTTSTTELPRHSMMLDSTTHFYCVWDKNNRTFPNGKNNFKFGNARPQDDRARDSLFLGRVAGDSDFRLITVVGQGKAADVQWPTFVPGSIAAGVGQNGDKAYLKATMLDFNADASLADMFPSAPYMDGGNGLLSSEKIPIDVLSGLDDLPAYGKANEGNWNAICALPAEIIHIDPRDNGASTLICADMNPASTAPVVEVYCPAERDMDFGVGSSILLVGSTWVDRMTSEQRMGVSGWWVFNEIPTVTPEATETTQSSLEDGEW